MKKRAAPRFLLKSLLCFLCFAGLFSTTFSQTTYTFINAGNWNGPGNWAGGIVPPDPLPAGDSIVIDANCTKWYSYTSLGTITVNTGDTLHINDAPLNGFQVFTNSGTFNNYGGVKITNFGFDNASTGMMTNLGGGLIQVQSGGGFNNYGSLVNNLNAYFELLTNGYMDNENGGVVVNNGNITSNWIWSNNAGSTLTNNKSIGTGTNGGFFNLAGATININNTATMNILCTFTNNGTLNLNPGGTLIIIRNPLTWPAGTFNWSSGSTVEIGGTFTIGSGQTITVPQGSTLRRVNGNPFIIANGGTLINNGTFLPQSGTFTINNGGTLINNVTGTINLTSAILNNSGTITNHGVFNLSSVLNNLVGATFTNNGTVNNSSQFVNSGTLTNTGVFNLNGSGLLELNTNPAVLPGGTFNWNSGTGVKIGTNGVMTLTGTLTVATGRFFYAASTAPFTVAPGASFTNNGTTYITGPFINNGTLSNSNLVQVSGAGTLSNAGTLSTTGHLEFYNSFTNSGTLNLTNPGFITFNNSNPAYPQGTFNWTSGAVRLGNQTMTLNTPATIPAGGEFRFFAGTLVNNSTLTNNGTVSSSSSGTLNNSSVFINNGTFSNLVTLNNNGILKGTGLNQGAFTNPIGGIFEPGLSPGCYTVNNGFTNLGTLNIEINGNMACSEYDRVQSNGPATKGGTLNLTFGTTPTVGSVYSIINNATSYTGSFSQINVTPASVSVTQNLGTVTVTGAPSACTTLSNPANSSINVPVTTVLTWAAASGSPTGYRLNIGTTPGGTQLLNNFDAGNVLTYDPPGDLANNTTYYVTVISYNTVGDAFGCLETSFTTQIAAPTCVSLIYPANNATGVPVSTNLEWSAAASANGYLLSIGTTPGGTQLLNSFNMEENLIYDPVEDFNYNTTYYVTVIAYNNGGNATGCTETSFTTQTNVPDCSSLSTPSNGATDVPTNTNLIWSTANGSPTGYRLDVGTTPGGTDILNDLDLGNTEIYDPPNELPSLTTIYVKIKPYNATGVNLLCPEESFTTQSDTPPGCTLLSNPTNGEINVSVSTNLSWSTSATAIGYRMNIGTTSGGTDILDNFDVGNVTEFNPLDNFPYNTIIYVNVIPYNGAGNAVGCVQESFTTEQMPITPGCVILTNPTNGSTNFGANNSLAWSLASGDILGYILNVGTTSGGTDILNYFDVGNNNNFNPPGLFPYGTTVYVTIFPYNIAGTTSGCPEESFTTGTCIYNLTIANQTVEDGTYKALGEMSAYLTTVANGSFVTFTSDTAILLEYDFTVEPGGVLTLEIESCPNNVVNTAHEKN